MTQGKLRVIKPEVPAHSHPNEKPESVQDSVEEAFTRMDYGTRNYFQRTLKELVDIKEAIDKVLVVAITDTNGVIKYVNDRFCELYKYSREEIIGKTHCVVKSGDHPEEFYKRLWTTITRGKMFTTEIKNRAKDGSQYWAYMVIVPFLDDHGKPYQYVSFRTDITAIKEAEAERIKLIEANAALAASEAAVQARDRFVSMAAHELKTPLTSLQLLLDLLSKVCRSKREHPLAEDMIQMAQMIELGAFQTRRLTSIINDFLDVSRIAAGRLQLNLDFFDLSEMVRDLIAHSREDFNAAGCQVTIEAGETVRGTWDKARLEQVVINLISNAMKYGQGKPIRVSVKHNEPWAVIEVQDHGIGIPKEFQTRLFQRFERADTARHYRGTGLGLWITNQIVDAHRGKIGVRSELGIGSTFVIELPIRDGSTSSEEENGECKLKLREQELRSK